MQEIRIRVGRQIILKLREQDILLEYTVSQSEILQMLERLCENSIYAYKNQICEGFITVKGGHRVGITGNSVVEKGKVVNINYIYSLNFRIAKQIIGCSTKILKYVLDIEKNSVFNTLIVSSPGAGKTTLLRDLLRKLSDGMEQIKFKGITVGLVDERGEIAAMHKGVVQNEIGKRTDILDNVPKAVGMKMLIRSMSPKVISADEIGSKEDVEAINYAVCSGVKGIFTAHGGSLEEIKLNPAIKELIDRCIFERIIFLKSTGRGEVDKVYCLNKINSEYILI